MLSLHEKAEKINNLKNGKGVEYLLDEAYKIFGNPILIHDMEYKAIALNKNVVTDDPIWNEYATTGTVGHSWLDFFKNECFLEEAANTKSITFLTSDKLKYDRIFGKVFNKNKIQIGCAVILACDKAFEDDIPVLFERFCAVISAELSKIDFYTHYGQAYFEKLVGELVAGVDDLALYTAHLESIYMHLKSSIYLAVIDIGKRDPRYLRLQYFRDLFKQIQPEYAYAICGKYILAIISTDELVLKTDKDLHNLNQLFHKDSIYAGVSRPFENLLEMDKYYKEAMDTLACAADTTDRHIFLTCSDD